MNTIKKIRRHVKPNVKFITMFNTKKTAMLCNTKDVIPTSQKSNIIYKIECPGCHQTYVGKTDRNYITRIKEHGSKEKQPMYEHLHNCHKFKNYVQMFALPNLFLENEQEINFKKHVYNAAISNATILDKNLNWSQLCFLEAYYIKLLSPVINHGLKASKELQLFR